MQWEPPDHNNPFGSDNFEEIESSDFPYVEDDDLLLPPTKPAGRSFPFLRTALAGVAILLALGSLAYSLTRDTASEEAVGPTLDPGKAPAVAFDETLLNTDLTATPTPLPTAEATLTPVYNAPWRPKYAQPKPKPAATAKPPAPTPTPKVWTLSCDPPPGWQRDPKCPTPAPPTAVPTATPRVTHSPPPTSTPAPTATAAPTAAPTQEPTQEPTTSP